MASITPITASQDTEQSTGSTSYVSANCETAALADGVVYFIAYRGNAGGSDTSAEPSLRLLHGSTTIGEMRAEGRGLSNHWDSSQCSGYTVITGNGTDTLAFEMAAPLGSNTTFAGAMSIKAMPLTDLVLNSDYWFSGTDAATLEVTDATVDGWDTQRGLDFTLPDDGDYLVFMSHEAAPSDIGATANAALSRFRVGGTTIGSEYLHEWEDNTDFSSVQIAQLVTGLSAGDVAFEIEVGSRVDAEANFRRSRIVVFRAASFDQIVQTIDTSGQTTASTSMVDFTGLNTDFTPNQEEYVMVLGHVVAGLSTTNACTLQIRNNTDAANFNVDAGEYENDNGFDSARDQKPTLLVHTEQISVLKNYRMQFRAVAGTAAVGRNPDDTGGVRSSLIVWGLTTVDAANPQPIFFGTNS